MVSLPGFLTDLNTLSIIVFLTVVAALIWRDRRNIERYGVVFVRRTKHGVDVLDDVADIMPWVWRKWSTVGIVVGFVLMVPFFLIVVQQTLKLFLVGDAVVPVSPILPTAETVTDPRQTGYFGLPFWPFMIAISVLLVVHEMMHGVIARVEDFEVEYVGLLLLAFIPGAFVQPKGQKDFFEDDGNEAEPGSPWDQGNWVSRLRVLAAGPWANVTLAILLLGLMYGGQGAAGAALADAGLYEQQGIRIANVSADSPAEQIGLEQGMVITAINGSETRTISQWQDATSDLYVGEQLTVTANGTTYTTRLGDVPGMGEETNTTYNPAMIDYLLPWLEQRYPGSIDAYERYNDVLTGEIVNGDDKQLQRARWQWIKTTYPELADTADRRIAELQPIQEKQDGYLGIWIDPEPVQHVDARLEPFVGPVQFLMLLLWAIAILNFFVGTANLLPIKGLDGGWMVSILLDHYAPEKEPVVTRFLTVTTIGMILISFTFLILRFVL